MKMAQPKKMLIINILDILKKYSDFEHRLSQQQIMKILENEYSMTVDRKAVKRNLLNLADFGFGIEYKEAKRKGKNGEEESVYYDWYIEREFTDSELRLLIDSVIFSKHIPKNQSMNLIEKIENLSNKYFKSNMKHILSLNEKLLENKQLFYIIEVLDEAIVKKKQVQFIYNDYGTDFKLHPRLNSDEIVREYIINPYQLVAANGRYYLICNYDKYDNIAHYRIDRISNIEILDTAVKPLESIKGLENGLNLPRHMAEHIYMFAGESVSVSFRINKSILSEVIDWFGEDLKFFNETNDTFDARIKVNETAMFNWSMQYGPNIEILSPEKFRMEIAKATEKVAAKYK